MRYTEIISEITRARMSRYMGGGGELDLWSVPARRERLLRSSKPLSDIAGLNYYVEKTSLGYEIFVIDPENTTKPIVGHLSLTAHRYFPVLAAMVDAITVREKYRGRGIAPAMYRIVLFELGLTLLAGSEQTPGGRKNWLKIADMPGVEVKGYVPIYDSDFDDPEEYKKYTGKMIDKLMAAGGEYLGTSKHGRQHFFVFDVVPGTGELEPAVQGALKLYHGPTAAIIPGLLARATNK